MGPTGEMTVPKRLQLRREPECAATARRWLEDERDQRVNDTALNNLKLVATELINNAYIHGNGDIELVLELLDDRVRVEVIDEGEGAAVKIRDSGSRGGGWGLRIVDQLAISWGAYDGTTHVWAELPLS
ncbi:MAG: ATP-binding protein [Solirubrobacterales bacterium]|nr:ATP-binding protein [Solirubrobacterales bacterium]